jgi:N-succinyldiaminopimelate aminotransferase
MPDPATASRLARFGTSVFAEITRLAIEHDAVNLSQGFPDFDGPEFLKQAVLEAVSAGHNQYARTQGVPELNEAIAAWWGCAGGRPLDPHAEITVASGCTEALAACCLGLFEPGDEVVVFEPYYDSYLPDLAMAGAVPKFVTLHAKQTESAPSLARGAQSNDRPSAFAFDLAELRAAFGPRTRAVILNTPHNPTGKVFSRAELDEIASLCIEHDAIVIADEVYERLTFDPAKPHVSIATLPGMAERTITLSSLGKTFSGRSRRHT